MSSFLCRPSSRLASMILSCVTAMLLVASPLTGADRSLQETTSLGFVPADVAFYSSMLRGGEIYNRVANSNALKKFRDSSMFKMGMAAVHMQLLEPDNPLGQMQAELAKPENAELAVLLGEMFSDEAFVYGNSEWTRLYEFYVGLYRDIYGEMLTPENMNQFGPGDDAMFDAMNKVADRMAKLEVPTLVAGFRVADKDRVLRQLARLEKELGPLVNSVPALAGRLRCESIAGSEYLTFKLDGGMIPWDETEEGMTTDKEKQLFRKFRKDFERRVIAFALGVRGDYLLLTVGPSLEHVADLGRGDLLADRAQMAPVVQVADRPLVSISYMDQGFAEQMGFGEGTLDYWVAAAKMYVTVFTTLGSLSDKHGTKIVTDIEALAMDLRPLIPKRGVQLSYSYLTDHGLEGFYHDHSEIACQDGSKPLTLLDHVGGDPIFFAVTRTKHNLAHYDLLAKWVDRSLTHVDLVAEDALDEQQQQEYEKAREALNSLLARIDTANRDMLIPALEDGQVGLVVDGKMTSNAWCPELPPAPRQLPMAEPALVFGVSDARLLARGVAEYAAAIQEGLDVAHDIATSDVPQLKIPPPQTREVEAGKLYAYPLPDEMQIDPQIEPNAGLSKRVLALSASPSQTERLLKKSPLLAESLPRANRDRPLAAAAYFNMNALIEAAEPWADFVLAFSGLAEENGAPAPASGLDYAEMVRTTVELLKCIQQFSSVTYQEDDSQVTHFEWRFQDAP